MSKIAQVYANSLGVKLGAAPEVPTVFEPTPPKYICISTSTGQPAKNYDYWSEVIFLLSPILAKNGYQILQVGTNNDPVLPGVVDKRGIALRNTFHVIRNSALSLSGDTFNVHLAGMYGIPVVAVYGSTNPKSVGPYWHGKCILIEPDQGEPSYRVDEYPKRVNQIKPETIAQKCFEILGIKETIRVNTTKIGAKYNQFKSEVIPDSIPNHFAQLPNVTIRLDVHHNESAAAHMLGSRECAVIANKPVEERFLKAFKDRIAHFVYVLEEDYSLDFVKLLHTSGVRYHLTTKMTEKMNELKLKFNFDFNPVQPYSVNRFEVDKEQLFKTTRHFISKGQSFSSLYHYKKGIPFQGRPEKIGDAADSDDWMDSGEFYYVFEIK